MQPQAFRKLPKRPQVQTRAFVTAQVDAILRDERHAFNDVGSRCLHGGPAPSKQSGFETAGLAKELCRAASTQAVWAEDGCIHAEVCDI